MIEITFQFRILKIHLDGSPDPDPQKNHLDRPLTYIGHFGNFKRCSLRSAGRTKWVSSVIKIYFSKKYSRKLFVAFFIARSALSVRGYQIIWCPLVRPSIQKIIDFCEGDMEGASPLLSTGSLNFWFWRIQKWTPLKKFKSWYRPVQGPLFGPSFGTFLATR